MTAKIAALSIFLLTIFTSVSAQIFDGYSLYNRTNNNTAYLIDKDGNIAHSWSCDRPCNYTVLLKENGNIVRGAVNSNNDLNGAAIAGLVQELDADANVVWEFTYSNEEHCSHHDLDLMPNGNVLLTAWEVKTNAELEQADTAILPHRNGQLTLSRYNKMVQVVKSFGNGTFGII